MAISPLVRGQVSTSFDSYPSLDGESVRGSGEAAYAKPAWWSWTAPATGKVVISTEGSDFNTYLGVYIGDSTDHLDAVAANEDTEGMPWSQVEFQANQGTVYRLGVFARLGFAGQAVANVQLSPNRSPGSVVGGDDFQNRRELSGTNALGLANNFYATRQNAEPPSGGRGETVWWTWTAPADGVVEIDTAGSEVNTVLKVFVGDQLNTLQAIRWNNDVPGASHSRVLFQAQKGITYQICVDTPSITFPGGNILLHVALTQNDLPGGAPGMDNFNARGELVGAEAIGCGNIDGATFQPGEPIIGDRETIWWQWTAPVDGQVVIDTVGSECDTLLAIYTGDQIEALRPVTSNDNADGEWTSRVQFAARRNQRYQIAVASARAIRVDIGNVVLNVHQQVAPDEALQVFRAVEVELFARKGVRYQLQRSKDFILWTNIGGPFVGQDRVMKCLVSIRETDGNFFRAKELATTDMTEGELPSSSTPDSFGNLPTVFPGE